MFFPVPVQELNRHSKRVETTGWRERYLQSMIARLLRA
jgi:hypothetical protein